MRRPSDRRAFRPDRLRQQLVVPVELQRAVLVEQQRDEVEDVAREHVAGVHRAAAGEVQRTRDGHAAVDDVVARLGEFAVAAGFRGQIDDDAAGLHAGDHRRADDLRRRAARYRGGGDDHVDVLQVIGEPLLLQGALLVGELAGVAALARGADAQVEEIGRASRRERVCSTV